MPDCCSCLWFLELYQLFLCSSGAQGPREPPKRCPRRPSWLQPPEHRSPANWCGECPLQGCPNEARQKNTRCQNSDCASTLMALTSCQLSYESQVAGQTRFNSWETTWGNPSLSLLAEQFQSSTEYFFSKRKRDRHEHYMRAWAHLWAACTGWEI